MSSENSHPLTTVATRSLATGKYMARVAIIGPMPFERLPFDAETHLADVQMFQQEGFGAIYLIDDDRKAIVETGTSWDANRILNAVRSFGLKPADVDAPGHAPHELTILDERNRCVYTGDAAGLYFPGDEILMPVTPAPAFDLEKNLETFRRLLALKPRALLFSHYGPHTKPKAAIEAMMAAYPAWARVVRDKLTSIGEQGVLRELYDMSCRAAKRYPRDFLERRIRVSIAGLAGYHERMEHAARTG